MPTVTATTRDALRAEIERCRRLVDAVLLDPARQEQFAPAHLRRAVAAYLGRPAKRLRPALVLLCCGAVGGDEAQAVPAAAAVEAFHTWTLIHDDVIDNDALRRGQPTVHVAAADWARAEFGAGAGLAADYGRDVAILAGDALHAWAGALLLESACRGVPDRVVLGLASRMESVLCLQLLEGELLDVQFSYRPVESLREEDVLAMLRLKTGALLEYAAQAGAAIGLRSLPGEDRRIDALGEFAALCGVAFQLQDDVLGLCGDETALGKPVGSDLREGKITVPILHARLAGDGARWEAIRGVLGRPGAPAGAIAEAQRCLVELGSLEYTQELARGFVRRALACLGEASPAPAQRDLLASWAESLVQRSW